MINQLVLKIKQGTLTLTKKKKQEEEPLMDLWEQITDEELKRFKKMPPNLRAPKMKLPGHAESYNPSDEYLMTKEEIEEWEKMDDEDKP